MDLEKLAARSRATLTIVSFIGFAVLVIGVLLIFAIIAHETHNGTVTGLTWEDGLEKATGPTMLAGFGLLLMCIPWGIMTMANLIIRRAVDSRHRGEQLMGTLENHRQLLEGIRETASLSDAAKQVAYRAEDLAALRAAIREDMDRGDFEAATMLANEMEARFGYAQEADKFRDQINETSSAAIEARVHESLQHIETLLGRFEWNDATREARRLQRLFPTHDEVQHVSDKIDAARDTHKRELLKNWKDATGRDDIDTAVALLKQLDQYLTPSEAEAYKENARDVFRKKLAQLQAQFAMYVHDKNWAEALRLGKQITDEFPNTRMAAEVRERLPILQEKAQQPLTV